jgi:hypothetical protein
MPPRQKPGTDEEILADWDTGDYSKLHGGTKTQSDLSYKHHCSIGRINKLVKGRTPQNLQIVNNLIYANQELANKNEFEVNAVNKVVDERTKHIQFFNDAAVLNVRDSLAAPCESQNDFRARAETIAKGREVVLGKTPDTAIQINNTQQVRAINPETLTIEQKRAIASIPING